jgi:hypothetical protein
MEVICYWPSHSVHCEHVYTVNMFSGEGSLGATPQSSHGVLAPMACVYMDVGVGSIHLGIITLQGRQFHVGHPHAHTRIGTSP